MEKNVEISLLLDLYGSLLTKRQLQLLKLYYEEDLSLGEIAQQEGVSRQAVLDSIHKGEASLFGFEKKLGLLNKEIQLRKILAGLIELAPKTDNNSELIALIDKFKALLEETDGV